MPLAPTAFRLVAYFAQNHGKLLAKDELVKAVWPNVFVTDDSLIQCVAQLRAALADRSQNFIKTVRGRGYIFDAVVPVVSSPESPRPDVTRASLSRAVLQKIQFCTAKDEVQLAYGTR